MSKDNTESGDEELPRHDSQLDGTNQPSIDKQHTPSNETRKAHTTQNAVPSPKNSGASTAIEKQAAQKHGFASWFAIPAPLKELFDLFPLVVYPSNQLPLRAHGQRAENILYIWVNEREASAGRPSFNPSCLKWQTYLKMSGIPFTTISSNNHASPSGSLPFLLSNPKEGKTADVIPGNKVKRWIKDNTAGGMEEPSNVRYEIYSSLLENNIRKAWLYQLYLHPANEAVVRRLYVEPASSNPLVQLTILHQLRSAAETEIIKASPNSGSTYRIDESEIMRDAEEAFEAFSTLLGDASWFFCDKTGQTLRNQGGPGLFDASVFAYTHLIFDHDDRGLDGVMRWKDNTLKSMLERCENLLEHKKRILDMYY